MKKILFVFLLIPCFLSHAQEFSFSLYFEDAAGNKDTLILGYDQIATTGIDSMFGEENTLYEPFNKEFEVRAGNLGLLSWGEDSCLMKRQIVADICKDGVQKYPVPITIYIRCEHFPLTISWDPVFNNTCRDYSFLTDWNKGAWFDAVGGGEQGPFFVDRYSSIVLNHLNLYGSPEDKRQEYVEHDGVNLNYIYFAFASYENIKEIWTDIKGINTPTVSIYPNPTNDILYFHANVDEFKFVQIKDLSGQICLRSDKSPVDVSSLPEGIYILELRLKNSSGTIYQRFIKKRKNEL